MRDMSMNGMTEVQFSQVWFEAELHIRNELKRVYDTCSEVELNNLIHNLETIQSIRIRF